MYTYMNGKTTDSTPTAPPIPWAPMQQQPYEGTDSDEEEKLERKLDEQPVPVIPLGLAPSASCGRPARGPAVSSSAMPVVVDLTGDD